MSNSPHFTKHLSPDNSSLISNVNNVDSSEIARENSETSTITEKEDPPYSVFTKNEKAAITTTVSLSAFFSPFSTNIYFPALHVIQQGISPSFWGAMADTWGRRPVYIATFLFYSLASFGAGCSQNYPSLLVMRMLQAVGSSSAIAVGAGTIGDISTPAERGGYMGIYSMLTQLGPLLGPFLDGFFGF
ncbi:hypothetical protein RO3G_17110 [Rhizopus delemar RA 99-880]|uniref:Major facilitator superfamily (MFS) profile domain-containing protein n=1 Tax=Rhizopus delemar (strain RA 99-880 / ATCC MYA-4621 / FGSC 9543 / NRRL 43880) TaxID=246409 RepID=I1CVN2_RHIO9|nr:hypothetical protein RO3G_17110 [Rhizopus delemar RA 99-880]|eukprot:EIE92512.1 hypothetical protein RO3G_17110 [Rhizopus delemar RA 99-880]